MEKFPMNSGGGDAERDLEIQGRLSECGEAGEPLRENGKAGNGPNRTVTPAHRSSPRMLVALDIVCLIVATLNLSRQTNRKEAPCLFVIGCCPNASSELERDVELRAGLSLPKLRPACLHADSRLDRGDQHDV
ncbi:phosphatidic acid phosphatase type 2D [Tachysurus ichikawai]